MTDLAKRAVACAGWQWMRGMLCQPDEDGYAARILHVGTKASRSETADSYEGGGIITRGCIREGSLPDLNDDATVGCLWAMVREAVREACPRLPPSLKPSLDYGGEGATWRECFQWTVTCFDDHGVEWRTTGNSEAEALVQALEAAWVSYGQRGTRCPACS